MPIFYIRLRKTRREQTRDNIALNSARFGLLLTTQKTNCSHQFNICGSPYTTYTVNFDFVMIPAMKYNTKLKL